MPKKWLRFTDLQARGLVNSWPALKRKVETQGFPPGALLGPNTRAWDLAEIEAWEASRPTVGAGPRGAARLAATDPQWARTRRARPRRPPRDKPASANP
jgi:hypothetical protein